MIGIYKITSPSKKVYIGQSWNIKKRFSRYKTMDCAHQVRLYNSFKKYGVDNHKFEILCQCSIEELNEMERFYQDAYCSINDKGLNCILTQSIDRSGELSIYTKSRMSLAHKGKTHSHETKAKMSLTKKNMLAETKLKMSENSGKKKMVLHLGTGVYFDSAKKASKCFGYKYDIFKSMLNGQNKVNKTNCIYV